MDEERALDAGIRDLIVAVGQGPTRGRRLSRDEARLALEAMMDGRATPAQTGALLILQRYRGESAGELVGYVEAARACMLPLRPRVERLLDIGSPYDGRSKHVVASVAASIVAAAAGVPILMHGERDIGPKRGVTVGDVIAALGVETDAAPDIVERGIEACGLGYVRQARIAPALYALKPVRDELGLRTPLQMVEKIYDPAQAPYHMIGMAHLPTLEHLAPALQQLGFRRSLIVQGMEGHEDAPTSRGVRTIEVDATGASELRMDATELGLEPAPDEAMAGGDAEHSARFTLSVLEGRAAAAERDLVLLNAALRIRLTDGTPDLPAAIELARRTLTSGDALRRLHEWRDVR